MSLTREQIDEYISSGGIKCPVCGDWDITGGSVQIDAGVAWQDVSCSNCDYEWTDIYTLTDIKDS